MDQTYFRRGFGLKKDIKDTLTSDYASGIVDIFLKGGHTLEVGPLTFRLAKEFGFCYGVDRAVEYAYETRAKFPERPIALVGEIIHNPHVNARLLDMGVRFLERSADGEFDFGGLSTDDVVIMPAFGVTIRDFERLRAVGCVLVDTTCGSVLNVWKRVESYARDGYTAIIHGKSYHEETKATASQVTKYAGGRYLVVYDMDEARVVCDFIEGRGDAASLAAQFAGKTSAGFDFGGDLQRVGLANQTTMLAGESLAIAAEFGASMARRYGEAHRDEHFRSFDTICSATQERQDAVLALLEEPLDLMVVVGGYNSSNTCNLAAICAAKGVRTVHIEDAECIDVQAGRVRHQPIRQKSEVVTEDWLSGTRRVGLTAGASTPNNKIGETVARMCESAGMLAELREALTPGT